MSNTEMIINPCLYNLCADLNNIYNIYGNNFNIFYSCIPKEYEHKEKILKLLYEILNILMRTCPEYLSVIYVKETNRLLDHLYSSKTNWNINKAWNFIDIAEIEGTKIIRKIMNNI